MKWKRCEERIGVPECLQIALKKDGDDSSTPALASLLMKGFKWLMRDTDSRPEFQWGLDVPIIALKGLTPTC